MKLRSCVGCGRPVLELRGQFTFLDSFYVDGDDLLLSSVGAWHAVCLKGSGFGEIWFEARYRNFVTVRGYRELANLGEYVVLQRRDRLALAKHGLILSLAFAKRRPTIIAGGIVCFASEDMNLELSEKESIAEIQTALREAGEIPLWRVIELVGIEDKTVRPEILDDSVFRYQDGMPGRWSNHFVCGRVEYGVCLPRELEHYV